MPHGLYTWLVWTLILYTAPQRLAKYVVARKFDVVCHGRVSVQMVLSCLIVAPALDWTHLVAVHLVLCSVPMKWWKDDSANNCKKFRKYWWLAALANFSRELVSCCSSHIRHTRRLSSCFLPGTERHCEVFVQVEGPPLMSWRWKEECLEYLLLQKCVCNIVYTSSISLISKMRSLNFRSTKFGTRAKPNNIKFSRHYIFCQALGCGVQN